MDVSRLKDDIQKNRPKISQSSINTYTSILKNLFKKFHKDGDEFNLKWFEKESDRIDNLKDVGANIRKTLYSALISITDDAHNKKYKEAMMKDAEHYRSENLKQNKTKAQEENWVSQDDIKIKFNQMFKDVRGLWNKQDLNKQEYKKIQDLILVALTSGFFIPPRRCIDWTHATIKDIDEKTDNYLKKDEFHFNRYKGSDKKGEQIVKIPKELNTLLKKFIKINKYKYLLNDSQGKKMNSVKLNQHLASIWGKKSGVNIFRHSFISEKYPIFNVEQLKKDATDMGSSANMMLETYIKKN